MIISNDLTRLIQSKPNVNIEEVLLHKDFSSTIKEESEILYRRILKENGKDSTWFDKIVKYALFDTTPPKIYSNFKKQISINSSNCLEHCGIIPGCVYMCTGLMDICIITYLGY